MIWHLSQNTNDGYSAAFFGQFQSLNCGLETLAQTVDGF